MATDREGMTTEAGNPYFAPQLASAVVDLPDAATAGDPAVDVTTLTLGSHTLRLRRDARLGQAVIDGYDTLGPSRTARSLLRLSCGLAFQIGEAPSAHCEAGSIHILDDALMFVGSQGSVGSSALGAGQTYVLLSPPDLVVAIERLVTTNAQQRRELSGFRAVLVNPIHNDPLVITTVGLDQRALAMLVSAGETFMRDQVGSKAGWRPLGDGWETMEWNGAPPSATPAATPTAPTTAGGAAAGAAAGGAVAAVGAAVAGAGAAASASGPAPASPVAPQAPEPPAAAQPQATPTAPPAAAQPPATAQPATAQPATARPPTASQQPAATPSPAAEMSAARRSITIGESSAGSLPTGPTLFGQPAASDGSSKRWLYLVAAVVAALLAAGALYLANRGDGDTDAASSSTTTSDTTASTEPDNGSTPSSEITSTTAASTTTTASEPTSTTTEATTTTVESTTTSTGPAPKTESQQLAVWGFTEPAELASPSGKAVCPSGEPSATGKVVGVNTALNVRDGADSSYAVLQRLVLGYDEVDVYPDAVTISSRGTRWVTIALAMPPGTPASAERRCGWAATQFLSYDS